MYVGEGHIVLFDREAPFELKIAEEGGGPKEMGTLESIRVKVLQKGGHGPH